MTVNNMVPWEIQGRELVNCNCNYGCPCQFNARPTHGHCEAAGAILIEKGHFGDTRLDGLKIAFVFQWPGAVHEGRGQCLPIVDENADEQQRNALLTLMSGEESEPFATMFSVYSSTMETVHPPVFTTIDFDLDVEARTGRIRIDGLIDTVAAPIRNPVTGEPSRSRIDLPNGFEYELAEMASASSAVTGPIPLELKDSYGQLAYLHLNNHGPIRGQRRAR